MTMIIDPLPTGPTSDAQVATFEAYIGHKLPADYRAFLLQHNGGHPKPDAFLLKTDFGQEENPVLCFFPLRDLGIGRVEVESVEELPLWPLHCAWDDLQHDLVHLYEKELEQPLLPIGTDGSSNYLCLVLAGDRAGSIVFLDHEMAEETLLAESFDSFLTSLQPAGSDTNSSRSPGPPDKNLYAKTQTLVQTYACSQCGGTGQCYCIRKGSGDPTRCIRCNGTGHCRVCAGTGKRSSH